MLSMTLYVATASRRGFVLSVVSTANGCRPGTPALHAKAWAQAWAHVWKRTWDTCWALNTIEKFDAYIVRYV